MKNLIRKLIIWAFRQEALNLNNAIYRISHIEDILTNNPTLKEVSFEASVSSLFSDEGILH